MFPTAAGTSEVNVFARRESSPSCRGIPLHPERCHRFLPVFISRFSSPRISSSPCLRNDRDELANLDDHRETCRPTRSIRFSSSLSPPRRSPRHPRESACCFSQAAEYESAKRFEKLRYSPSTPAGSLSLVLSGERMDGWNLRIANR